MVDVEKKSDDIYGGTKPPKKRSGIFTAILALSVVGLGGYGGWWLWQQQQAGKPLTSTDIIISQQSPAALAQPKPAVSAPPALADLNAPMPPPPFAAALEPAFVPAPAPVPAADENTFTLIALQEISRRLDTGKPFGDVLNVLARRAPALNSAALSAVQTGTPTKQQLNERLLALFDTLPAAKPVELGTGNKEFEKTVGKFISIRKVEPETSPTTTARTHFNNATRFLLMGDVANAAEQVKSAKVSLTGTAAVEADDWLRMAETRLSAEAALNAALESAWASAAMPAPLPQPIAPPAAVAPSPLVGGQP
jgi:hypothetical protein